MSNVEPGSMRSEVARALAGIWWLPVLRGIVLVLFGVMALFRPGMTIEFLATLLGFYLILDGLLCVFAGATGQVPSRFWTIVRGVVGVLVGLFVVAHPVVMGALATTVVVYLIAFSAMITGILEVAGAIRDRKEITGEGWLILGGVLTVVFGILVLVAPMAFGLMAVRILGVYAIIFGIGLFVFAYRICQLGKKLSG